MISIVIAGLVLVIDMDLLEKYMNIGSKLGYEGQELRDFVSERESIDGEERHAERDSKKSVAEAAALAAAAAAAAT